MPAHPEESDLLDFAAGVLGPEARSGIIEHLDACARCRQIISAVSRKTQVGGAATEVADASTERTRTGDPLIGAQLGEYRVLERLSQGGMGILYRGEQPVIGKAVAIKLLLQEAADDPNLVHRLLEEARAVNAIRHPNIVDIFSFGQLDDGRHYMVMELLEGESLASLLHVRRQLMVADAIVVLTQSMAALEAAHAAGVIHRDLKPDNIFVNARPDGWIVTLLDFGLAKRKGSDSITAVNVVMGTPGYMAPEQIRGQPVSPKTDIYAMGVVAWQLLAGHEPFEGGSMVQVMQRHLDEPPPPLRSERSGVPPGFESLVMQMMAKDPEERPTATSVRRSLLQLGKQQPVAETIKAPAVLQSLGGLRRAPPAEPEKTGVEPTPAAPETVETPITVPVPVVAPTRRMRTDPPRAPKAAAGVPFAVTTEPGIPERASAPRLPSGVLRTDLVAAGFAGRLPLFLGGAGAVVALGLGWYVLFAGPPPTPPEGPTGPHPIDRVDPRPPVEPPVKPPVEPPPVEPPPVVVTPPPLKTEPPAAGIAKSWRCATVTNVGAVGMTLGGSLFLFEVKLEGGPLLVTLSTQDPAGRAPIDHAREAIVACRSTPKLLVASDTRAMAQVFSTVGVMTGLGVELAALTIGKDPEPGTVKPVRPVAPAVTKAEVEKAIAGAREKVAQLSSAGTRRIVGLGLDGLEERLGKGEAPGVISKELRALLKQYDLP